MAETQVSNLYTRVTGNLRKYVFVGHLYARTVIADTEAGRGRLQVAHVFARVIKHREDQITNRPHIWVSKVDVRIVRPAYPDMQWLDDDMFLDDVIFPTDISYNSDGSEVFSTDVNVADSGHEQRIGHWAEPLMEYNVAYGVRTMEQLHALKRLFRVVQGKRHGFRFRDPMDYTSSFATGEEARSPDQITAFDQIIGTGDGSTYQFQLVKTYDYGGVTHRRIIRKPEVDTVLIAAAGVEYPPGTYTVDHSTGIVTLHERITKSFGGVTMERLSTTRRRITWTDSATADGLYSGDWVQISGFSNILNRVPESEAWQITAINAVNKQIEFTLPAGRDTSLGVSETAAALVNVTVNRAPPPGVTVTAGYKFHVPVRFDTDRLPIKLESYGVGSASEVKLRELRAPET